MPRRLTYDEFRTSLTFGEVRRMLWVHNPDPATWRYKRRRTVLGFWRQLKQQLWARYQDEIEGDKAQRRVHGRRRAGARAPAGGHA